MNKFKKIVIPVLMADSIPSQLKFLREMDLNQCEIHFVHVSQTITHASLIGNLAFTYPAKEERLDIERETVQHLSKVIKEVLPLNFEGKVSCECLFGDSPKIRMSDYITEMKADLVIMPTRKKRGFFDSSFAQFITRHTDADVYLKKI